LKNDFYNAFNLKVDKVTPAVLVGQGCTAYDELKDMESGNRPKLKTLSDKLGIKFFTLEFQVESI
jgi:hypothetical protein